MVLDIRFLPIEGDSMELHHNPEAVSAEAAHGEDLDLEALLTAVATGSTVERSNAILQLRTLVPGNEGVETLCRIVEDPDDERRLPAMRVLGFHRQWISTTSGLGRLLGWTRSEPDPEVVAAMVWALRQRDAVQEFLLHPIHSIARESALGLPVNDTTIGALIYALLSGQASDIDVVLQYKLRTAHPSVTDAAVEVLLSQGVEASADEVSKVLRCLSQKLLFQLFVEGRGRPAWSLEQTEEERAESAAWHRIARLTSSALLAEPSAELIRYLVNHSAADETFARRHESFIKASMCNTEAVLGTDMLDDFERLAHGATDDRLAQMAQLLVDLGDKLAGGETHSQVSDLLERWKKRSPALKLKIYHMQQGLH
ncbi:MAG: hypothetical protein VX733_04460 [Candidatus Latescibacterota bacterium]|nr:hypothetical protein [Candidatus Latescibacterota bacterium]